MSTYPSCRPVQGSHFRRRSWRALVLAVLTAPEPCPLPAVALPTHLLSLLLGAPEQQKAALVGPRWSLFLRGAPPLIRPRSSNGVHVMTPTRSLLAPSQTRNWRACADRRARIRV